MSAADMPTPDDVLTALEAVGPDVASRIGWILAGRHIPEALQLIGEQARIIERESAALLSPAARLA